LFDQAGIALMYFAARACASSGGRSPSVDAHFGLSGQTSVDVRVTWPGSAESNQAQDVLGVSVPARVTVHEGGDPTSAPTLPAATGSMGFRLAPNPTRGAVTIELARGMSPGQKARIFDAAGVWCVG
jgi:hypothetical protein